MNGFFMSNLYKLGLTEYSVMSQISITAV